MTSPAAADREGCAVLELPITAPDLTVTEAIVDNEALDVLERDADARRVAADAMRRAHDHGWVIVARGDLSGSVVCHAEAFFESMAAAERSAREIACPPGTVLEWSPGLTSDQYEPGGRLVPVPLAGAQLPGPHWVGSEGLNFRRRDDAEQLSDVLKFHWEALDKDGELFAVGLHFLVLAADGRIERDYTFVGA